MASNSIITQRLLVEGADDQHVVWALCQKFQLKQNFEVVDCKGIEKLLKQIPVRLKESGITTLGIIIDADLSLEHRWKSISTIFQDAGADVSSLSQSGFIGVCNEVKIGIWIMPNNRLDGMLEDFSSFLIPENDKLLPIAGDVLDRIEDAEIQGYGLIHRSKALIATWLAWQEDPGTPMGLAITKRYLSAEAEICKSFVDWLRRLFEE